MSPFALPASESDGRRIAQIEELLASGEAGVSALLGFLDDPSWAVRRVATSALASLGAVAAEPLCAVLREKRDREGRLAAAVEALVAAAGGVDDCVLELCRHDNPAVICDGAQILGRRQSARAVAMLAQLTHHPNDNVALAAIEALGRIGGGAAVDSLLATIESRHFFRTFPALDVLGRSHDPRAVAPLGALVRDPLFGPEAIRALGHTGSEAAIPYLLRLLDADGAIHLRAAAEALSEIHERVRQRTGTAEAVEAAVGEAGRRLAGLNALTSGFVGASPHEQMAMCRVLSWVGTEEALETLVGLVELAPEAVAAALVPVGRSVQARLREAVKAGDSTRRRLLLPLLRGKPESLAEGLRCLEDSDPAVRILACDVIARAAAPSAVGALFAHLDDPDLGVVQAVVGTIQSLGSNETEALALQAAKSAQPAVRRAALRILSYFGFRSGMPTLFEAVRGSDERSQELAIGGLPLLDDPSALDELLRCSALPQPKARAATMRALGQCPVEARSSAALLAGLGDADAWVRYYACQALGRRREERAAAQLEALLRDPAGQVQVAAVEALSHLEGPSASAALRQAAESPAADIRRAALLGLGLQRRADSLPLLLEAASSSDSSIRLVALSALTPFDAPEVLPIIVTLAHDRETAVRDAALGLLAGRTGVAVAQGLVSLLANTEVREQVVTQLSQPVSGRLPVLCASLQTAGDEAPILAAALFQMRSSESADALIATLYTGLTPARRATAPLVRRLPGNEATRALQHAAAHDADDEVRRICAEALFRG